MKLKEWIKENNCTISALAKAVGYSESYISALMRGAYKPGSALMMILEIYTDGKVKREDWKNIKPSLKLIRRREIISMSKKLQGLGASKNESIWKDSDQCGMAAKDNRSSCQKKEV